MSRPEPKEHEAQELPSIRELFPQHFPTADAGPSIQQTTAPQTAVAQPAPPATDADDPRRRYVCGTCGKRFQRPSSLRNHITSHTGERPHECPHPGCGKRFSTRSNMRRHAVVHVLPEDARKTDTAGSIAVPSAARDAPIAGALVATTSSPADLPAAMSVQSEARPATRRPGGPASMFATLTLPRPPQAGPSRGARPTRRRSFDSEAGASET
ncbi:C2H2-type zinc finger protein [Phanerochaete sordida]|uniref:C2H2-type zinc finger protein n=1 Tax=Phanerochaete sordida TaxID=48140 RepID=A0A9P3GKK9_9APHY|nr:C2H2-type zinc finger protein [Phanerochaete sordida]